MAEGKTGIGVGSSAAKATFTLASSCRKFGDRQLFSVEIRPGETTTVSWKRLMKDANKLTNGSNSMPDPQSPPKPIAHPNLESHIAPGKPADKEMKDEGPHRFSAVIEKIERLYMGNDSSDDEMDDNLDDDQYDTEDSFIDDAELDEYFEVDNSEIKHDGFFVNRGKLERIEPAIISEQQEKKRKRKVLPKADGKIDDGRKQDKQVKAVVEKSVLQPEKSSFISSLNAGIKSEKFEDLRSQNPFNAGTSAKKKFADVETVGPGSSLKISNGDAPPSEPQPKENEVENSKAGVLVLKSVSNKSKYRSSDISHQKLHNKVSQSKIQPTKAISITDDVRMREKNDICELPDLNVSDSKTSLPIIKPSHPLRRDGSSVRPKLSILEKAIRELEKVVAEARPPAVDNQEADTSSQTVKRRLPREVKLKLAKVARVEYAIYGRMTKELLSHLNGIVGHMIQLRSLKRNLQIMVEMGLSAKKEKDDKFQQIKKEAAEMIRNSASSLKLKQPAGASDDVQGTGQDQKGTQKRKFSMDAVMEDKICDLYDLYVDGLEEDAGPLIRKLYTELAELWPSGLMDNHGIKRAICRAKDRRRTLYNSRHKDDHEKMKRKNITPETVRLVTGLAAPTQPQQAQEKTATDSSAHGLTSAHKPVSNPPIARVSSPSTGGPNMDRPKQDKLKGSSSSTNPMGDLRIVDGAMRKKKLKRKPEQEMDETDLRAEKLPTTHSGEERQKTVKHFVIQPEKASFLPNSNHPS